MTQEYGDKKGEQVFYATKNKRKSQGKFAYAPKKSRR